VANDLQKVADILIMEAAIAFRKRSRMPLLVNRNYDGQAAQPNKRIDVPVYNTLSTSNVTAGTPSTAIDITPDVVSLQLDQWKETRFIMSDKEMAEVGQNRVLPEAVSRGIIALSDGMDSFILGQMRLAAYTVETAESSAALSDIINMRKGLNANLVPRDERRLVVSNDIESEFLLLPEFTRVDASGESEGLREGSLGRRLGFDIFGNDNLAVAHTNGNGATFTVNGGHTAEPTQSGGTSQLAVTAGTVTWQDGDLFTIAGDTQQYIIVSGAAGATWEIAPRLQVTTSGGENITRTATWDSNLNVGALAFHRLAYIFATRPVSSQNHPAVIESQAQDPVSGVTLRVEAVRGHKQLEWTIDVLYGGTVLYPEAIAQLRDA
jgi:hypothetical protein